MGDRPFTGVQHAEGEAGSVAKGPLAMPNGVKSFMGPASTEGAAVAADLIV
jgi:hypothetical protein